MLDRILKSYKKEKEDYSYQPLSYEISGVWQNEELRSPELDEAIAKNNIKKVDKLLSNFASERFTWGLSLIGDSFPQNDRRKEIEKNYVIWKKLTLLSDKTLEYPDKFGFVREEINEVMLIPAAMRLSYYAKRISDLVDGDVVEIGGGFGGVAFHLFRDFDFQHTYLDFDIFISSLITKYFLMNTFPDKKFLLYGEDKLKRFRKYDIVLMPHFALKELPNRCCEMIFNSHSLAEMGTKTIKEYLRQINRISNKYFLHLNHDFQTWFTDKPTRDVDTEHLIDLNNPKWELKNFKRIYRFFEPLMRHDPIDYYEYLYEKKIS